MTAKNHINNEVLSFYSVWKCCQELGSGGTGL